MFRPLFGRLPYASQGAGTRTLELLEVAHNYNQWIYDRLRPGIGRRVLEIGCGMGTITQLLFDRELVIGVDVVDEFIEHLQSVHARRSNVRFLKHDLSKGHDGLESFRFDSALTANVFEHIEDDLEAMTAVHALLQPGGTFAMLVPAHPNLVGAFDRALGHHRRYTKQDLRGKLEAAGFEVEQIRYSNPLGAIGWLVNVRLLQRTELAGVGAFDRLVPLLAVVDRLLDWPFGLQVIAIARKPPAAHGIELPAD
jgi:SAM-dependent methyltransferase